MTGEIEIIAPSAYLFYGEGEGGRGIEIVFDDIDEDFGSQAK